MTAALPLALAVFAPPAFPDPALVERLSEKRPEFNYREEKVPAYTLPPVLGDAAAAADWPARRAELVRLFERHVYGAAPPAPEAIAFNAEEESLPGVRWRTVSVECATPGGPFAFPVTIALPAGASAESPAPLFVLINNRGPELISKGDGGTEFFPWRAITDAGFAAAVFQNADLAPDNAANFDTKLLTAYGMNGKNRPADGCGALAAWGWGASRVLDYAERTPELDAGKVAVIGHSRGGKAAWWAAARDPRFSLAVSNESGCGGAALSRRRFRRDGRAHHRLLPPLVRPAVRRIFRRRGRTAGRSAPARRRDRPPGGLRRQRRGGPVGRPPGGVPLAGRGEPGVRAVRRRGIAPRRLPAGRGTGDPRPARLSSAARRARPDAGGLGPLPNIRGGRVGDAVSEPRPSGSRL